MSLDFVCDDDNDTILFNASVFWNIQINEYKLLCLVCKHAKCL